MKNKIEVKCPSKPTTQTVTPKIKKSIDFREVGLDILCGAINGIGLFARALPITLTPPPSVTSSDFQGPKK